MYYDFIIHDLISMIDCSKGSVEVTQGDEENTRRNIAGGETSQRNATQLKSILNE